MVGGTWDEKQGVVKIKTMKRDVGLSGPHPPGRQGWTGPAGRLPFPDTPNGSGPNRFLSPLKPKVRII